MSYRSSLNSPSISSGNVGSIKSGDVIVTPVGNQNNTSQYLGAVNLPAGTYVIQSSVQIVNAGATGNQYIGISLNLGATDIVNMYREQLASAAADDVFTFTNVITLTDASTSVSLWLQTNSSVASQTYQTWAGSLYNAPIRALKIA
jgi:hypothetical protein